MTGPTALAEWRQKQLNDDGKPKTQAQIADLLHVSQASVADWELGKKTPKATHMLAIERLTGGAVPMASWADDTDAPPVTKDVGAEGAVG